MTPVIPPSAQFDALVPERPAITVAKRSNPVSAQTDAQAASDFARRTLLAAEVEQREKDRRARLYVPGAVPPSLIARILKRVTHPPADIAALKAYDAQLQQLRALDLKYSVRSADAAFEEQTRQAQASMRANTTPLASKGRDQIFSEFAFQRDAIARTRRALIADNATLLVRMRARFIDSATTMRVELERRLPGVRAEFGDGDIGAATLAALRRVPAWVAHHAGPDARACPMLGALLK